MTRGELQLRDTIWRRQNCRCAVCELPLGFRELRLVERPVDRHAGNVAVVAVTEAVHPRCR